MKTAIRVLAVIIALGIGGVSIAMTFAFGLAFSDAADRFIYAGLFGLLDAAKMLLPTISAVLLFKGLSGHARRARFLYIFLAVLSASSHVGLTLTVKDREASVATKAQRDLRNAEAERDRIQTAIAALGTVRSRGDIEADIATSERDPIFTDEKRSNRCANDTVPASLTFCRAYRGYVAERQNRDDLDRMTGELLQANADVKRYSSAEGVDKKANVLAKTLADKTGGDEWTILLIIAITLAVAIEACSSLLLELATAAGHKVEDQPAASQGPVDAETAPADTIIADETRDNAALSRPESCPKAWVQGRMQPKRGARLLYEDVLAAYAGEADAEGMAAASSNAFARALTDNGYDRKRQSKKTYILGAEVRAERARLKVVS
jgi:hypothetical protein